MLYLDEIKNLNISLKKYYIAIIGLSDSSFHI